MQELGTHRTRAANTERALQVFTLFAFDSMINMVKM